MTSKAIGCFFLDSSVLIPEILAQNNLRISKFKREVLNHHLECYFPDSVGSETERKIKDTIDFLGNAIKTCLISELENFRNYRHVPLADPITVEDIKALETLFYGYHGVAKAQGVLTDPVSLVEEWIILYVSQELEKGVNFTISELARELVRNVLTIAMNVQNSFDNLVTLQTSFVRRKATPMDSRLPRIIAEIELLGVHAPDSDHIARACLHQILTGQKVIFVTLDFKTILNRRKAINIHQNVQCCDPLYAFHHY